MKVYIIKNEQGEPNDFKIMKVADHLIADFEAEYKNKVLAMGKDLQEALQFFGEKQNALEPISIPTQEKEEEREGYRRRL